MVLDVSMQKFLCLPFSLIRGIVLTITLRKKMQREIKRDWRGREAAERETGRRERRDREKRYRQRRDREGKETEEGQRGKGEIGESEEFLFRRRHRILPIEIIYFHGVYRLKSAMK